MHKNGQVTVALFRQLMFASEHALAWYTQPNTDPITLGSKRFRSRIMHKLSVIIPMYNEEETVETLIERVESVHIPNVTMELILIDDCSTDRTPEILKQYTTRHTVHTKKLNGGKGSAIREGFVRATGDIVLIQDADLEYNPNDYPLLLSPILSGNADVVYGSRFVGSRPRSVLSYHHYLANKFLTQLSNICSGIYLTDMETCYKVFTKEVVDSFKDKLRSTRFGIEPELTAQVARGKKWRIYEVGISYFARSHEEGKKIGWKDGFAAIWHIIKFNWF